MFVELVFAFGSAGRSACLARRASSSPISSVVPATGSAQAARTLVAASPSPRNSSMWAMESTAAVGLAFPVPTMSGAEPWTGSNIDGPVRAGLRLALEARPMPPLTAPPRSVRMSPKRLSVTTTSYRWGSWTK